MNNLFKYILLVVSFCFYCSLSSAEDLNKPGVQTKCKPAKLANQKLLEINPEYFLDCISKGDNWSMGTRSYGNNGQQQLQSITLMVDLEAKGFAKAETREMIVPVPASLATLDPFKNQDYLKNKEFQAAIKRVAQISDRKFKVVDIVELNLKQPIILTEWTREKRKDFGFRSPNKSADQGGGSYSSSGLIPPGWGGGTRVRPIRPVDPSPTGTAPAEAAE